MKFRIGYDYYDGCQYGSDDEHIFVRNGVCYNDLPSVIPFTSSFGNETILQDGYLEFRESWKTRIGLSFTAFIVYFAGKFFPVLNTNMYIDKNGKIVDANVFPVNQFFFYTLDDIFEHLKHYKFKDVFFNKHKKRIEKFYSTVFTNELLHYIIDNKIANGFIFHQKTPSEKIESFSDEHFIFNTKKHNFCMYANIPYMEKIQFYKVYDPYRAFMELEMYFNSVLVSTGNEMTSISNESKILKAGFDKKISFRHPIKLKKETK